MMSKPETTVSFEFFPPKTDQGREKLWETISILKDLQPRFMTMTYGAGGTTHDWTLETAIAMREKTGIPAAAHLTLISTPKEEIFSFTDQLWEGNVRHIVALRGDIPEGMEWPRAANEEYFNYTSELVEALKARHDFEISVGAYPEKHPDAPSLDADIAALKLKCDAGADRAITQFFFDNDAFMRFVEKAQSAGITTPIVPGILPIANFDRMMKFAGQCGVHVPNALIARFEPCHDQPEEMKKVALDVLITQCEDLIARGVPHLHFYTLNNALLSAEACKACGLAVK